MMATVTDDLEPCRFFNIGMVVWTLLCIEAYEYEPMWIPGKVIEAAGYSAYIENKHHNISQWIDLRHNDVMVKKAAKVA